MKRILLILSILVMSVIVMAQAPQQFSYQALIRDVENEIVSNRVITLQVSIVTINGNAVYSETHQTATNENGVVSVAIGSGTTTDDFSQIDWSKGEYFLQTTIDLGAGEQLVSGDSPLLSVPYALYAEKAGNAVEIDLTDYAKKSDIPEAVDLSGYYSKAEVDALFAAIRSELAENGNGNGSPENGAGAIKAAFSVAEGEQVYFSQGNLQYNAMQGTHACADGTTKQGTWRFAEHQYDTIGADNSNISKTYDGWIDLFGWGTSGWNSGANAYKPYSTSGDYADYYPGGSFSNSLTVIYANADWGMYNAISNGGNQVGQWRTLSYSEWSYVINTRADASSKKGVATVNNITGLILLPDSWTLPDGLTFISGVNGDFAQNIYSSSEWSKMEANGAVFLPAAGRRNGASVSSVGSYGGYWSSSFGGSRTASGLCFYSYDVEDGYNRNFGLSVRLVQDVE